MALRIVDVVVLLAIWVAALSPPRAAQQSLLGAAGWALLVASLGALAVAVARTAW